MKGLGDLRPVPLRVEATANIAKITTFRNLTTAPAFEIAFFVEIIGYH